MGYWGTGISSNDTFEDIREDFFAFYNEGQEVKEITNHLINSNKEILEDNEEINNFWFALALCQWECKSLEAKLLNRVTEIITSGKDIELWKELGAKQSEITKRKKALTNFLIKLNSERKTPRKRKKIKLIDSIFEKGDCLGINLSNGHFGALYVLESEEQTEYGFNLIAICDYFKKQPPNLDYFKYGNILISKYQEFPGTFKDDPLIKWFMAVNFETSDIDFEKVGSIPTSKIFTKDHIYNSYSHWTNIPDHIVRQPELIEKHGPTIIEIQLKSLR
ncbi:hypothetical protein [Flexithrix dorotheae]|uniref:hypothetical protein n=1 Tax=Flexithrix dorotheae TaxID=70993 RepID=UPI00036DCCDF|nr:hypothetical protein [Flexithrix dorotheae]